MKKNILFLVIILFSFGGIMINTYLNNKDIKLIPREVLFNNPSKFGLSISPNGKYIAYIAPHNGILNIFVAPINDLSNAKLVSNDQERGIRSYDWAYDNQHIFYSQDTKGDENTMIHMIDIESAKDINLTPELGVRNMISNISRKHPNKIIIANNKRNPSYFDLFELDLNTKQSKMIFENNEFSSSILDDDNNIRFHIKRVEEGGVEILKHTSAGDVLFMNIPNENETTTGILGFAENNDLVYVLDSRNSNMSELFKYNLSNNNIDLIKKFDNQDIQSIVVTPVTREIEAVTTVLYKQEIHPINNKIEKDLEFLNKSLDGEVMIVSRNDADDIWIIGLVKDDFPVTYYLYNRNLKTLTYLFSQRPELEEYELTHMQPITIKSRDGLDLVSYLSLPLSSLNHKNDSIPANPVPLILLVHGGPTARDNWGLNTTHQWLANRGYAVLSVNYRGSAGFGKKFFKAGFGQWSAKMHDDLIDAVNWSITNKITDKNKICIMGGSYGGYATLVGLTFTPDVFACGIDIVGPSNLVTLLNTIPAYWKPARHFLENLTGGNPDTEEGRKILESKSPINFVSNISKPLLIGQGANDPRVKQTESDQIVNKMKEKNIPVTYILFPDEGHGFIKPENRIAFNAVIEAFLEQVLKGRAENYNGDNKSSMQILEGKEYIPNIQAK